jgi:hypothetical protein
VMLAIVTGLEGREAEKLKVEALMMTNKLYSETVREKNDRKSE